jgi:hypothetical protein
VYGVKNRFVFIFAVLFDLKISDSGIENRN